MPAHIVMDKQSYNRSDLIKELCSAVGTTPVFTSPYSKSGNCPVERVNQTIEHALKHFVSKRANNLRACGFGINITIHASSEHSPFYLCYGRSPVFPKDIDLPLLHNYNETHLRSLESVRKTASIFMMRSQDVVSESYNLKHQINFLKVGDRVYVNFPNLSLPVASAKLSPFFSGPFTITTMLPRNNVFYCLITPTLSLSNPISTD